jgi:hypothetical protein
MRKKEKCRVMIPLLYIPVLGGKNHQISKNKLPHFHSIPLFCVKFVSGEDQGPSWGALLRMRAPCVYRVEHWTQIPTTTIAPETVLFKFLTRSKEFDLF